MLAVNLGLNSLYSWIFNTKLGSRKQIACEMAHECTKRSIVMSVSVCLSLSVVHHRAKFCGGRSYCCRDIAIFHVFLVKCKNLEGGSPFIWHNIVEVTDNLITFCSVA